MPAISERVVRFRDCKTACRIVGTSASGTGRVPLLMLHGGPGYPWWTPSDEEMALMAAGDRPVVFYDQLGCGRSDRPYDASMWTVDLFLEEIDAVREQLALDQIHLLGWSWGGMLAFEYLLTQPAGVRSVVLSSALHSVPLYMREARRLLEGLPEYEQATMRRVEENARESAPKEAKPRATEPAPTESQLARETASMRMMDRVASTAAAQRLAGLASRFAPLRGVASEIADVAFDHAYVCRRDPWPDQLYEMAAGGNTQVYETMWGSGEVMATGSLRNWDVTDRLGTMNLPALVITGRYDAVTPMQADEQCARLPHATRATLEDSAHAGMLEEPQRYWSEVFAFLARVEAADTA